MTRNRELVNFVMLRVDTMLGYMWVTIYMACLIIASSWYMHRQLDLYWSSCSVLTRCICVNCCVCLRVFSFPRRLTCNHPPKAPFFFPYSFSLLLYNVSSRMKDILFLYVAGFNEHTDNPILLLIALARQRTWLSMCPSTPYRLKRRTNYVYLL